MKRRTRILRIGAAVLGLAVLLAGLTALGYAAPNPALWTASPAPAPALAVAAPLPETTCTEAAGVRTCELWAKSGVVALPDGTSLPFWGFTDTAAGDPQLPGPTLIALENETLRVVFHNELAGEQVALAFPGVELWQPDLTGVASGASVTYDLPLNNPGTSLYEAGMTLNGTRQVAMGLFGGLIVRPAACPNCAYGPDTVYDGEALVILSELDPALSQNPTGFRMEEYVPRYWLINGKSYPQTETVAAIAGQTVLLRYLNAGVKHHAITLLGLNNTVLGADGIGLPHQRQSSTEIVWPGSSVDALVSVPAAATVGTRYPIYEAGLQLNNNGAFLQAGGPTAFGGMLTFLEVTDGGAVGDIGPLTSLAALTPDRTTGADGVTLSATFDETTTGGANVVAAEYFVGTPGAPGTGIPLTLTPGVIANASAFIDAATLNGWAAGYYTIYVHGQDAGGKWGATGSVVLNLDKQGPASHSLSLTPAITNGTVPVAFNGTADDSTTGNSNIAAATYSIDGGPAVALTLNHLHPWVAVSATIPQPNVNALAEGVHDVTVLSQDDLLNWGAPGIVQLFIDRTGPATNSITLTPATLDLSGPPPVATVRVEATFTDNPANGVSANLARAEGFIDVQRADGSGWSLYPSDGLYDEPSETAYFEIPIGNFANLTAGPHPVYVHAKDSAGNWGPVQAATITIVRNVGDVTAPQVLNLAATPNPTRSAGSITLTATAQDAASPIAAAEWWIRTDPGLGLGTPMQAADGAFDAATENITATINVATWRGRVTVYARTRDLAGNWSGVSSVEVRVTR